MLEGKVAFITGSLEAKGGRTPSLWPRTAWLGHQKETGSACDPATP
jgi:hypothetical protein